jgi:CBS domain-containing protein
LLGASAWRVLEPIAPAVPLDPTGFVIVGMMALFGSVAHAPLAVMLMVAEMTGNLSMLAPAMLAIGLATLVVGDRTIYRSQLKNRAESPAHRFRFAMPLMSTMPAGDVARRPKLTLSADNTAAQALTRIEASGVPGAPVLAPDGAIRGTVERGALRRAEPGALLGALADDQGAIVSVEDGLDDVLGTLADRRTNWAAVVSGDQLVGIISARDAMAAYRRALAGNVRQVRGMGASGVLLEGVLAERSPVVGKALKDAGLPRDVVLVAIQRGERVVVPSGATTIESGDRLTLFATADSEAAARSIIESETDEALQALAVEGE